MADLTKDEEHVLLTIYRITQKGEEITSYADIFRNIDMDEMNVFIAVAGLIIKGMLTDPDKVN